MKKISILAAGIAALFLAFSIRSYATPTIIAGAPQTITGSIGSPAATNTAVVSAFTYNPTLQQYTITHGSLSQTTDIKLTFNVALQNSTNPAVAIGTWYPTTTNAATETIYSGSLFATNYTFATVTATNAQSYYISYGQ